MVLSRVRFAAWLDHFPQLRYHQAMIESDVQSRLKVTGWPGAVIEVPPVLAYDVVGIREPWIEYDLEGWSTRELTLPVDTYLREARDVDFADVDELADFGARFGILGWWPWPELPKAVVGRSGDGVPALSDLFKACREQRFQQWGEPVADDGAHDVPLGFYGTIHVDEVRLYLSHIRDIVSLWRCVRGEIGLADVAAEWKTRVWLPPAKLDLAAMMLADMINPALVTQSLRVEVVDSADLDILQPPGFRWGRPHANTYQALCSQLRNDIAMNSDYYICGSEVCGRLFSRQRRDDTETVAQHRAGSRYCSITCRDRQKQLEHRRRQSAGQRAAPYKRRPPIKANGVQSA